MESNVPVLTTTREPFSVWMKSEGINRSKVTFDASNLFLKDFVEEAGFEFFLFGRRRCYSHGILTTSKNDLLE